MKKYLTGIIAVAIAVVAFAFTKPEKKVDNAFATTFYYEPASDFSSNAVKTKTNWKSNITPPSLCEGVENKACQFDVDDTYTHLNGSVRELNTSTSQGSVLSIATMPGANSSDFVPDPSTTGLSNIVNKP